jgi:hypothetical protein
MSNSVSRFPPDLAVVFGCLFMPLLALPIGWFVFRFAGWSFVYLGAAFCLIGVVLLIAARLLLYRQRLFWSFGSRFLDPQHRHLYTRGYAFIFIGIGVLAIVFVFPA